MSRAGCIFQKNSPKSKRDRALLRPMKQGFFAPSQKELRRKVQRKG